MRPVSLSPRAQADVDRILDYLSERAARGVASAYCARFDRLFDQIEAFPNSGSPREQFGKDVRILVEKPYVVFYEVMKDRVVILRVLDGRRRITRKLILGGGD